MAFTKDPQQESFEIPEFHKALTSLIHKQWTSGTHPLVIVSCLQACSSAVGATCGITKREYRKRIQESLDVDTSVWLADAQEKDA